MEEAGGGSAPSPGLDNPASTHAAVAASRTVRRARLRDLPDHVASINRDFATAPVANPYFFTVKGIEY
jgi:hypothetical protein